MRLIILLILIIVILGVFYWYNYGKMTFIKSPIDNNFYMVRDLPDKYTAVNLLATMRLNIIKLKDHLNSKKDTDYKEYKQYIEQLSNRIHNVTISESRGNEDVKDENGENKEIVTSYSVNKGEELVFCLRSRKEKDMFHTINILMYVILHEISHIACPEYGHGPLFKKIFAFFTKTAMNLKIYEYDDYAKSPKEYCGIYLSDSIV
jgi:predicted metal-dependent hydrolase